MLPGHRLACPRFRCGFLRDRLLDSRRIHAAEPHGVAGVNAFVEVKRPRARCTVNIDPGLPLVPRHRCSFDLSSRLRERMPAVLTGLGSKE